MDEWWKGVYLISHMLNSLVFECVQPRHNCSFPRRLSIFHKQFLFLLHVLIKVVNCLVTQANTAHDSKPKQPAHMNPYQPLRERVLALARALSIKMT